MNKVDAEKRDFSIITPKNSEISDVCFDNNQIEKKLY